MRPELPDLDLVPVWVGAHSARADRSPGCHNILYDQRLAERA